MTFADKIVRDAGYDDVEIVRHDDGDMTIRWPRRLPRSYYGTTIDDVAGNTDMDAELFFECRSNGVLYVCLHFPKEVARGEL